MRSAEERARADAHVAGCAGVRGAVRRIRQGGLRRWRTLAQPALPARLAQPLRTIACARDRRSAPIGPEPGFVFARTLAACRRSSCPAGRALGPSCCPLNSGRTPVTSTPTLTTTLTPTTGIAARADRARGPAWLRPCRRRRGTGLPRLCSHACAGSRTGRRKLPGTLLAGYTRSCYNDPLIMLA